MANCPNCNNLLGCSCQLRTASNGTVVCTACITEYENRINGNIQQPRVYEAEIEEIYIDLNGNSTT